MCFPKAPKAAKDTTPAYVPPLASSSTGTGDGVIVKGAGGSSTGVRTAEDEGAQRARRRTASQGLGL